MGGNGGEAATQGTWLGEKGPTEAELIAGNAENNRP